MSGSRALKRPLKKRTPALSVESTIAISDDSASRTVANH
jgi:hypothetical protein